MKNSIKGHGRFLSAFILIFWIGFAMLYSDSFADNRGKERVSAIQAPVNFTGLAKKLPQAVVNISTTQVIKERPLVPFPQFKEPFGDFFGDDFNELKRQSLGSGFIINKEGYILTNFHVIANATEIIVTLPENKKEYKATVTGQDRNLDIALIKIDAGEDLPSAVLGDSEALQTGEWVLAIGNPFGLGGTVTAGIVSQKGRIIGAGPYDNFIQTDASINPGNSGGPLFNLNGEVVGINTAIIAGGQGIGFATPINMVKEVLAQLKEKGKITRGWIGVGVQELTPELAESFGLKEPHGVLVSFISPGAPADKAGLKIGDIITTFEGKPVRDMNELPRIVALTPPGKNAEVKLLRDGKEKTLYVRIGLKAEEDEAMAAKDEKESPDKRLGLGVQPLTPDIAKRLGITDTEGVIISSVKPDGPAAAAGLMRGDVIKEIDRRPVKDMKDYTDAITGMEKNGTRLFLVFRNNSTLYVVVKLTGK